MSLLDKTAINREDFIKSLKNAKKEHHMSTKELSKKTGLTVSYLYHLVSKAKSRRKLSQNALEKIMKSMTMSKEEIASFIKSFTKKNHFQKLLIDDVYKDTGKNRKSHKASKTSPSPKNNLAYNIYKLMGKKHLSVKQLAKKAGWNEDHLDKVLKGQTKFNDVPLYQWVFLGKPLGIKHPKDLTRPLSEITSKPNRKTGAPAVRKSKEVRKPKAVKKAKRSKRTQKSKNASPAKLLSDEAVKNVKKIMRRRHMSRRTFVSHANSKSKNMHMTIPEVTKYLDGEKTLGIKETHYFANAVNAKIEDIIPSVAPKLNATTNSKKSAKSNKNAKATRRSKRSSAKSSNSKKAPISNYTQFDAHRRSRKTVNAHESHRPAKKVRGNVVNNASKPKRNNTRKAVNDTESNTIPNAREILNRLSKLHPSVVALAEKLNQLNETDFGIISMLIDRSLDKQNRIRHNK